MATTLQDYGRSSEKYGDIGFYYAFDTKFYFGQDMIKPEDVETWCKENCKGYYKIVSYTHKDSERDPETGEFINQVVYVDKVYLSDKRDATYIKLAYSVTKTFLKRPRISPFRDQAKLAKRREIRAKRKETAGA